MSITADNVEGFVYNRVKSNPVVKTAIRNMYQFVYDFLPDKEDILTGKLLEKQGYFWGLHDVNPSFLRMKSIFFPTNCRFPSICLRQEIP